MIRKSKLEHWRSFLRNILTKNLVAPSYIQRNDGGWAKDTDDIDIV